MGGAWGGTNCQVVSEDGKKVRRVHPLPEVDLEEVQVNAQSFKKAWAQTLSSQPTLSSKDDAQGFLCLVSLFSFCIPLSSPSLLSSIMSESSYHCWSCNKNSIMVNIRCWHPASAQGWPSQWGVVIAGQYHIFLLKVSENEHACELSLLLNHSFILFFAFSSVLRLCPLYSVSFIMSTCGYLWQLYPFWTSSSLLCFPSALLLCHYLEFLGDFMWKLFHLILVTFNHEYADFSILIRVYCIKHCLFDLLLCRPAQL
jgi:hypothetical protein